MKSEFEKALNAPFDKDRIIYTFENFKVSPPELGSTFRVSIYGDGGFKGDVNFDQFGNVYYFRDNFPGPKIWRKSDLRIRTFKDFLCDLQRVGFDIKVKTSLKEEESLK